MAIQKTLLFAAFLLLFTCFCITTTSAQLSPAKAPARSPPASTLMTPNAAPGPIVPKAPTIDIVPILRKAKKIRRLYPATENHPINQPTKLTTHEFRFRWFDHFRNDSAFSKLKAGFLNSIDDRQKVELSQFHTISSFIAISNFETQAGDDPKRIQLNVTTYGGSTVSMTTRVVNATVTGTVYTDSKLAVYQVDKVLLPIVAKAEAPAPAAATKGDSPKSDQKSSSSNGTDNDDDGSVTESTIPVDTSSSSVSLSREATRWLSLVVAVAFVARTMV